MFLDRIKELEEKLTETETSLSQAIQAPFKKNEKKEPPENPKKKGAPTGHPSWYRKKPNHIDETIDVYLDNCPNCGYGNISRCAHTTIHIPENLADGKAKVTCFVNYYYWCPECGKIVHGWGDSEIPNTFIGPDARSNASFLRHQIKISYNNIPQIFYFFNGLNVSPGAIVGFDNKLYKRGKPLYEALKETLTHTDYIHDDETGWKRHWLYIFTNPDIVFFHIDESRVTKVVVGHLRENYRSVLVTDFFSAYRNRISVFAKQKCLVHLLRDIEELLDKELTDNPASEAFLGDLKKLIKDAILLHNLHPELSSEQWRIGKKDIVKKFNTKGVTDELLKHFGIIANPAQSP